MRVFYFLGGPKPGLAAEFLKRLEEIGGLPSGWKSYPLVTKDGKAFNFVRVESLDAVHQQISAFAPFYEHGEILEIVSQAS